MMKLHVFAAVIAIGAGFFFRIDRVEWMMVVFCIGGVLALECVNTALERLADYACRERHPLIGMAKDAASAAVLLGSIAAGVVGGLIFLPKLTGLLLEIEK